MKKEKVGKKDFRVHFVKSFSVLLILGVKHSNNALLAKAASLTSMLIIFCAPTPNEPVIKLSIEILLLSRDRAGKN